MKEQKGKKTKLSNIKHVGDLSEDEKKIVRAFEERDWNEIKSYDSWVIFKVMSEFVEGFEKLAKIGPCVTIFGSARTRDDHKYYQMAEEIAAKLVRHGYGVISGGGPGIMEAANRGADDVGANNIGLTIVLPHEENPNPFITPALSFRFHYFAIRKMHFLIRARAMVAFPGGFGTMDELFEALTLMQTGKIRRIPILLFGKAFWDSVVNFDALVDEGVISPEDLDLFRYVETAEEAWQLISTALDNETATESE